MMLSTTTYCFIFAAIINIQNVLSLDCTWTVGSFTLDLSSIKGDTLSIDVSGSTDFTYSYTPCDDGLECSGVSDSDTTTDDSNLGAAKYMATQTGNKCNYLAVWNSTVSPKYESEAYVLTYRNGQDGRSFAAKFECDSSQSSYSVESVVEDTSTSLYTMTIKTSLACNGDNGGGSGGGGSSSGSNDDTDGLSLGWIIIIAFFGAIFLYCIIGYVICAKTNPDNGWGNVKKNTPHLNFWCLIPKLTWAGCCVTKEFTVNTINKMRGKGEGDGGYESVDDA